MIDTWDKVRLNCKRGVRKPTLTNTEEREGSIVNHRVMGTQKDQRRLNSNVNLGIKNFYSVEQP